MKEGILNPNSPVPLYYQLREIIVASINAGEWRMGSMVPSENQICEMYNVSRNTAKRALDELVKEGILVRKQGVGTFVTEPKIEQTVSKFYSFSDAIAAKGMTLTCDVLDLMVMDCSDNLAESLKLQPGELVTALSRLRIVDGAPFVLETSYIPQKVAPGLQKYDFTTNSLYKTLANEYGVLVTKAKEVFEPIIIGPSESKLLKVDNGTPALLLERLALGLGDMPVELCYSTLPGSKCRFYAEL